MKWGSKWARLIAALILVALMILVFTLYTITSNSVTEKSQELEQKRLNLQPETLSTQSAKRPQLNSFKEPASIELNPEELISKNGQLVQMHRPSWKFDAPLVSHIEGLEGKAAKGDNVARYILALNFRYCYNSPLDAELLEVKLDEAIDYNDGGASVDRIIEKYEYCAGLKQEQRTQFYTYLESAALDGFVAAQEVIGSVTPKFFMQSQGYEDLERDAYINKRDSFTQQQYELLERAAKNGSVKALISLSNMHHAQVMGANGQVKSFAINQLILELTKSNQIYNRYSWFKERQYQQLSPEQIEIALAMTNEWLEIINGNGTLYLSE